MKVLIEDACERCKSAGVVPGLAQRAVLCPDCQGHKVVTRRLSLEEFAKLFTWGKTLYTDSAGQLAEEHVIRAARNGAGDT